MITASQNEQAIMVAAKLYKARADARTILGDKFAAVMRENAETLKHIAEARGCGTLEAAMHLAKDLSGDPYAVTIVFAAVVEDLEPSEVAA